MTGPKPLWRLADLRIRAKLILLVTVVSAAAVVLLVLAIGGALWLSERDHVGKTALAQADLVARNMAAPLTFDDPRAAWENLRMFQAQPEVAAAAVYGDSGDLFAGYVREGDPLPVPMLLPPRVEASSLAASVAYHDGHAVAVQPVRLRDETLGTVMVAADLSHLARAMRTLAQAGGLALAASLLLAGALSARLQRVISRPLLELADLTSRVSVERDYTLRAAAGGRDELGDLARGFNAMLAEIQTRDDALERHRESLERTVTDRTRELARANGRLTAELVERKRAEELVRGQNEVLAGLATGRPLTETMRMLCRFLEAQVPGTRCAVLARSEGGERMRHVCAPRLPREYVTALDAWPAGPGGVPVPMKADNPDSLWTTDIATSPRWAEVRSLALAHGLLACWCMPVRSPSEALLGRICLYHETPVDEPGAFEERLLQTAAAIVGMALERERAQASLARMAHFDGLTGLPNRRLFTDRLTQALGRARRHGGRVAVLFVDLDRFKPVNDTLGHAAGDTVLRAVSDRLKTALRQEDTLARLGGDEFTVILEDITSRDDAVRVADRLLSTVATPLDLEGQEVALGASIGISLYPEDGADAATLVKNADVAMYRAKQEGKGVFCFFAGEMQDRVAARMRMETALRHALERGEFRLMFQPQVEVAGGRLVGAEALLRWHNPDLGEVGPDVFVPILEETGLIFSVGEWVLAEACRHWRRWNQCGSGRFRVAVNVSGRQLYQGRLPQVVRRTLDGSGLQAACLELELTESVVMENAPATVQTLRELERLGVTLAVDDFGTGYSSLSYLREFPIRALKIDRSFVRDITTREGDRTIAAAVISLAHSLDLHVVAEGVETEDQLEALASLHCDLAQGYLFGRPMEADAFGDHLARWCARPRPAPSPS